MKADQSADYIHPHVTARGDRVSLREAIGLGFGRAVVDGTHGTLHVLLYPVYNMTLGVNPALISTVIFIQRLWDAMLDPLFGQYSDNFRSRWGRRRPLLFVAAIPLALLFTALWWFPIGAARSFLFAHLLLVSLAFYAAHSLFAMPLGGLTIEATDDYHERTRIAGATLAFGFAAQVGSQWIFPLTRLKLFGDAIHGVRWVSLGCGAVFIVAGLIPVLLCRERLYKRVAVKQKRVGFIAALRAVWGNQSFMTLLGARCAFSFGFNVVGILGNYMYFYYVFGGDLDGAAVSYAVIGSSYHVAAIVTSLAVYPYLERRIGKRLTLQLAACTMVVGCVAKILVYQPGYRWLPLFVTATNGVANAGVALISTAMLGDIADYDEWQTGLRREGLFNSLLNWVDKAGNSLGSLLTGYLLYWIGFDKNFGAQSESTRWLMKLSYVVAPALGGLVTFLLIRRYQLSQDQMYEVKIELARRRAARAPDAVPASPAPAGEG